MKFKGWQLRGTKNNNGLIFKRNDTDMSNISFLQFDDFEVNNFDVGMWVEGFSHTLKDTSAQNCNKGIILIRPNSVNCINVFVYNCTNGVIVNPVEKYRQYHQFYFQGSIQSCDVGMSVNAGYETTIELYTEHNKINDLVCGKGKTDRGLWDFNLRLNSNNECSECCVYFDNIVSGNITFNAVGLSTEIPHFITRSNCSDVTLNVRTSCIKSSTLIQTSTSVDGAIKILKDGESTLKIYSSKMNGKMSYYHDRYGLEADGVLHLKDGRYALLEFKLGSKEIDDGAKHLLKIEELINEYNKRETQSPLRLPDLKIVITGTEYGYKREDGVFVVPIGCLKD